MHHGQFALSGLEATASTDCIDVTGWIEKPSVLRVSNRQVENLIDPFIVLGSDPQQQQLVDCRA